MTPTPDMTPPSSTLAGTYRRYLERCNPPRDRWADGRTAEVWVTADNLAVRERLGGR